MEIRDQAEPECQYRSIMISTAADSVAESREDVQNVILVVNDAVEEQLEVAKTVQTSVSQKWPCKTYTLSEAVRADRAERCLVVFLVELTVPFLYDVSETDFYNMRLILTRFDKILWAMKTTAGPTDPRHYMAVGLGRSLMSEDSKRMFVTLSLDNSAQREGLTTHILASLNQLAKNTVDSLETDYIVRNGALNISRIVMNDPLSLKIRNATLPRTMENTPVSSQTALALKIISSGSLPTIQWEEVPAPLGDSALADDEVLIEVRAIGLSRRDHLAATGKLDDLDLGTECAGIIEQAGCNSGFVAGDKVFFIGKHPARSRLRTKANAVAAIVPGMDFCEAATIPTALWLSYHSLVNVARLQQDDSVLIHQAETCVGQMAIQLAKTVGARVLVTVSSAPKGDFIRDTFSVAESAIFNLKEDSLLRAVRKATNGIGVDVIFGPIGVNHSEDFDACLAAFGRLVDTTLYEHSMRTVNES